MFTHRQWTRRFILLSSLSLVLVGAAVFVVDPLQHYRRAAFYRPLKANERYYNSGFIKHYDYDCIIIGTSMVENFIPSEVGRKLSMRVMLAPTAGAGSYEEYVTLNTALRTGKVKAVIWGLDVYSFIHGAKALAHGPGSMPFYLYDDNPLNDYQYLLNIDVLLTDCRYVVAANLLGWRSRALDLDSALFSGDKCVYSRAAALEDWRRLMRDTVRARERNSAPTDEVSRARLEVMERSFDSDVMSLVERYPDVRFCFFYPPYSILCWVGTGVFWHATYSEFKRYVFKRTRDLPNVRLFDFQDVSDIILNLDNYKDYDHYSPEISKFIIEAMSRNEYLVTDDNVDEKISRLENQVRRFVDSLDAAERADSSGAKRSLGDGRTGRRDGDIPEP